MALTQATAVDSGDGAIRTYTGGLGVSDNDVVLTATGVSQYRIFDITTTAGAADVNVSYDGTNYASSAMSLQDLGSASLTTSVVVTAANRVYRFTGCFEKIKILQAGATPPADVILRCYR